MHRLGFPHQELTFVYNRLKQIKNIITPITIMTHLADADNLQKNTTPKQIKLFDSISQKISAPKSIANSAGILAWADSQRDWVRPGLMLYGISPILETVGKDFGLKPVMTLVSKIIAINIVEKGEYIGYGGLWQTPEKMPVGVVGIGYGDGYPRNAKNGTPTLVNNRICPMVGRVSMDMITIDLRACPGAKIGDEVILWGEDLPIETLAMHSNSIGYELLCNVSQRVQFTYYQDDKNED
jgi:alanine racemase